MAGEIKRICCCDPPPRRRERHKSIGVVIPQVGPFKGQRIDAYKRCASGLHGYDANGEEVYIFYYELKPPPTPTRRIK